MKKVVFAAFLACAVFASGLPLTSAAQTANPPAAGASAPVQMPDAEYQVYTNAINKTNPQEKAAAIEAYLTAYPQSSVKAAMLETLMMTYFQFDHKKALDAADRLLQVDPNNPRGLLVETYVNKENADATTDPAAKQTALDAAASYAQKGLAAPKPAAMAEADFKKLQDAAAPVFYSAIATAALNKKDTATAIDNYKKELAAVPVQQTQAPGQQLQDTYELALAYLQSTPPDLLNCAFYATRFVAYAPEPYKSQIAPTAKYCYRKYHGGDDGYDALIPIAQANLNPPADFAGSIKPAPTPKDIVNSFLASTPDLSTAAISDREFVLQNGTPEQQQKVWDTMKGKSVQLPDALVIASTPTSLQLAISDDAKQSKTADFTFNLKAPEEATTAAAKKAQDALAAATAPGQTVTVQGTYDSYTPTPIMITMSDGEVILPKAKPAAHAPAHAPAHRAPARKK